MSKVDIQRFTRFQAKVLNADILELPVEAVGDICDVMLFVGSHQNHLMYIEYEGIYYDLVISDADIAASLLPFDTKLAKILYKDV